MIHNDEQFKIVREQLMHVENALLDLRKTVLAKNKQNYEVLAEADVDMIWQLRAELDEYLGLHSPPTRDAANEAHGSTEELANGATVGQAQAAKT